MIRRKGIVGLCLLCALAFSAIAAQGASAATKGTTVFTCKKSVAGVPPADFVKEHCKAGDIGTKEYGHVAVAENLTTHFTATSANTNPETNGPTNSTLKATVSGAGIELTTTVVHAVGGLTNKKEAPTDPNPGEHYVHGHEIVITYSEVKEKKLGCEVVGLGEKGGKEMISTAKLTATTTGEGDFIKFAPEAGSVFAEFELKGCAVANTYKVVGSLTCKPEGATINCNHEEVTAQGNLRIGSAAGPKAGYDGKVTLTAGAGKASDPEPGPTSPVSVTTVETP